MCPWQKCDSSDRRRFWKSGVWTAHATVFPLQQKTGDPWFHWSAYWFYIVELENFALGQPRRHQFLFSESLGPMGSIRISWTANCTSAGLMSTSPLCSLHLVHFIERTETEIMSLLPSYFSQLTISLAWSTDAEVDHSFLALNWQRFGARYPAFFNKCYFVLIHIWRFCHYGQYIFQNQYDIIHVKRLCSLLPCFPDKYSF